MEKDMDTMDDIKKRADNIILNFSHVTQSKDKGKAFLEYMKSNVTEKTAKLEQELSEVLDRTLEGLKKLDSFWDAVIKLAVTSLHVFKKNKVLHLPTGISFDCVRAVITAARLICPLMLEFKRDTKNFFLPKLQNVEVLKYQLNRYVQIIEEICDTLDQSSFGDVCLKITDTVVDLKVDLSEDNIRRMLHQIELLDKIRKDPNFQMLFLFQNVSCSHFIEEFNARHPKMLQSLKELEDCAAELEKMSKGAKISSVAGSSVGAVGSVLSIVGLALAPVTAGASLVLTMTGVGLGITSGVNSAVTTGAEIGVNRKYQKKASQLFQDLTKYVQSLQACLQEVFNQAFSNVEGNDTDVFMAVGMIAFTAGNITNNVNKLAENVSALTMLKSKKEVMCALVAQKGKAIGTASKVASDIPDIGKSAAKVPLALSKSARAGLIVLNGVCLGLDVFFICKDSISLAKGSETEVSQFIRARAALWRSEVDSWKKIRDSLTEGMLTFEKKREILDNFIWEE